MPMKKIYRESIDTRQLFSSLFLFFFPVPDSLILDSGSFRRKRIDLGPADGIDATCRERERKKKQRPEYYQLTQSRWQTSPLSYCNSRCRCSSRLAPTALKWTTGHWIHTYMHRDTRPVNKGISQWTSANSHPDRRGSSVSYYHRHRYYSSSSFHFYCHCCDARRLRPRTHTMYIGSSKGECTW